MQAPFSIVIFFKAKSHHLHTSTQAGTHRYYLAGYLLRSEPRALTLFRCSRNPAVAEPPSSVSKPMLRLEDKSLEKLLAMMNTGRKDRWPGHADQGLLME